MENLVFGCVAPTARACMARVLEDVAHEVRIPISMYTASSYEELARAVQHRLVDLAWLPPIAFVALDRQSIVKPLVASERGGGLSFQSVIIVHRNARFLFLKELAGLRAAWVDPFSASGYVFPRVELAAAGVDINSFCDETFYESHEEVVRAVAMGHADFGGTFATLGPRGEIVRSAWMDLPDEIPESERNLQRSIGPASSPRPTKSSIRILATLGTLPADLVAARADIPAALQTRLTRAFVAVSRNPHNRLLLLEAFGADELKPLKPRGYEILRRETEKAAAAGLL